jgi:hypothetical protein
MVKRLRVLKKGWLVLFLMTLLIVVYVFINRYWVGSIERQFLAFLSSSDLNKPKKLYEVLSDLNEYQYDYVCMLGPYQAMLEYKNNVGDAPNSVYESVNSILKDRGYRKGYFGMLGGEARWAFMMFDSRGGVLSINEVSNNRISLISISGGRDCFKSKSVSIVKEANSHYPYGYGLKFVVKI